jgi:hypothetical protein
MINMSIVRVHQPGLKISSPLVFSRQHQSPGNSSGIEPRIGWAWAGCHFAATNATAAKTSSSAFSYQLRSGGFVSLWRRRKVKPSGGLS